MSEKRCEQHHYHRAPSNITITEPDENSITVIIANVREFMGNFQWFAQSGRAIYSPSLR